VAINSVHARGVPMTTYRWPHTLVNPSAPISESAATIALDNVCRDLWRANAAVRWDNATHDITFRLNHCKVEVFDTPHPFLLISGPTDIAVRDVADQLGYCSIDDTIHVIKQRVDAR
jgi:hypothetical protein